MNPDVWPSQEADTLDLGAVPNVPPVFTGGDRLVPSDIAAGPARADPTRPELSGPAAPAPKGPLSDKSFGSKDYRSKLYPEKSMSPAPTTRHVVDEPPERPGSRTLSWNVEREEKLATGSGIDEHGKHHDFVDRPIRDLEQFTNAVSFEFQVGGSNAWVKLLAQHAPTIRSSGPVMTAQGLESGLYIIRQVGHFDQPKKWGVIFKDRGQRPLQELGVFDKIEKAVNRADAHYRLQLRDRIPASPEVSPVTGRPLPGQPAGRVPEVPEWRPRQMLKDKAQEDKMDKLRHRRKKGGVNPEVVEILMHDMRDDEIPEIDIRETVARDFPGVAPGALDD